jgi:hypothetical protein
MMRRRMYRTVGLLLLFLLPFLEASAGSLVFFGVMRDQSAAIAAECTLFVSLDGSDENTGMIAAPFRTIQKAARVVEAGDVVCVREGRYAGFAIDEKFGTEESPIVFMPYADDQVIIDSKVGDVEGIAVVIQDVYHLIIQGFEIMDSTIFDLDFLNLDPNKPEDLEVIKKYRHRTGIRLAAWDGGSKYVTLEDMEIHHTCGLGS